ncbi:MAG: ABC transporter ATP-binding protein, partial [Candidimonas sp.]
MNAPEHELLTVRNLVTTFPTDEGEFRAVDGVDLSIRRGEVVCLVGESGSGKSVTGFSIMRLIDKPGKVSADVLRFDGVDLLSMGEAEFDRLRGRRIAMVFQEPMTALNPSRKVGNQIAEVFRLHERIGARQAWARAVELMDRVGIRDAAKRASAYPHELSGGMRQRVMIAIAFAMKPDLIIADEPTTALDVTL